jgi:hypothetical protein
MARRRYGEVISGSGKSHQGRRITMAEPVSSIIGDLVNSRRSIAHSDDFEGHKLIQTNSRQPILLDLNTLYWCPASRDQIKPLLVQPQISTTCSYWKWWFIVDLPIKKMKFSSSLCKRLPECILMLVSLLSSQPSHPLEFLSTTCFGEMSAVQ